MKKLLLSLLMFSSLLFGGMNNSDGIDYKQLDKLESQDIAKMLSNEFAKSLPMQIDYLTKALSMFSIGNTVITKKGVDIEHKDLKNIWLNNKNDLIKAMFKLDSQNICYTPVWKYLIYKKNIIAEFNYTSNDNKPLFSYTVEKEDCDKIK